jgi:nucleoside-diphosphate-sugar epimerase
MEIEKNGLRNIVGACRATGTSRLVYLTSLGIGPDSTGTWTQGRWKAEQFLFQSGLDVTSMHPGQIVGKGGFGFDSMIAQTRRRWALVFGDDRHLQRGIAVDDLVYYLVGILRDRRSYGQAYDVGCDDTLTYYQMVDAAADALGRPRPRKIRIPRGLILMMAPFLERNGRFSKGAIRGLFGDREPSMVGDPKPIRGLLPRTLKSYRRAVEWALEQNGEDRQ